jgi:DNA/RNA-binding domain of Phe-tRNA-synthetase-like protein
VGVSDELQALGLRAAWGFIERVTVTVSPPALLRRWQAMVAQLRRSLALDRLGADPMLGGMRAIIRALGSDPVRHRPSAEALIRRVLSGAGPPPVNVVVDANNLCALITRLPFGSHDAALLDGPIRIRRGAPDDRLPGAGPKALRPAGQIVVADARGPFAGAALDLPRAAISGRTKAVFTLALAPAAAGRGYLEAGVAEMGELLETHCGARLRQTGVVAVP